MTKKKISSACGGQLTDFQCQVFKVVSQIPLGQTRSYAWVARKIGKPRAARAVGQALNKNPYLLIVPCHRVVQADGSLGGFALGAKVKKELLDLERSIVQQFRGK